LRVAGTRREQAFRRVLSAMKRLVALIATRYR
jgi:hypothetical protein